MTTRVESLSMLTGKTAFYSIHSVQEFIEIEAWLLLTFFICLNNQLRSIYSIVKYLKVQMFEKDQADSKNKRLVLSASFKAKFEFHNPLTGRNY